MRVLINSWYKYVMGYGSSFGVEMEEHETTCIIHKLFKEIHYVCPFRKFLQEWKY